MRGGMLFASGQRRASGRRSNYGAGGGSKTRGQSAMSGRHVFTFREARAVSKREAKSAPVGRAAAAAARKANDVNAELEHLLQQLGVGEDERARYKSMCETCEVGIQKLDRSSSRALFGEEETHDDCGGGGSGSGIRSGACFLRRKTRASDDAPDASKKSQLGAAVSPAGPKLVYFLTIVVDASQTRAADAAGARAPDTIRLCLPPPNGRVHGTNAVNQERLADLMLMKLFFVVRFVYRSVAREAVAKRRQPAWNRDGGGPVDSRAPDDRWCPPVIVVKRDLRTAGAAGHRGVDWYGLMKEKIRRGDGEFARRLSLSYCCNLV